ncbi:MAG: threonine ammonia-lyase [Oscillospiraceae bacterium]|nr:threonine ammonia-lyase [Oscillospiraceae bacterium]
MDIREFEQAAARLKNVIHYIPVSSSRTFSEMSGSELYLKYENQQKTGSFKVRGAYNKVASLVERGEKPAAVVASSAGNHAQGVAYGAASLGIKAAIVMPESTPIAKVKATQGYGAEVILYGSCYDDAYQKAIEYANETNAVFIHPFNDIDVICGQGTLGLEILRDVPGVDVIFVPAGGGGLLAGIAACVKMINPRVRIIGVQADGADAIVRSFERKELVTVPDIHTIADGIAVKSPGDLTVGLINKYVDKMVSVSDEDTAEAILLLMERAKQVVEPAGAVSLAAALGGKADIRGKKTVCLLSGGNIDVSFIHRIVETGLIKHGRHVKINTIMLDKPGSLEKFAHIVAASGGNIIKTTHDRQSSTLRLDEAILQVTCEVSDHDHGKRVIKALKEGGFDSFIED